MWRIEAGYVNSVFKVGKLELMLENLRWRGAAKVRVNVALGYACIYTP